MFTNGHVDTRLTDGCYKSQEAVGDSAVIVELRQQTWVGEIRLTAMQGEQVYSQLK